VEHSRHSRLNEHVCEDSEEAKWSLTASGALGTESGNYTINESTETSRSQSELVDSQERSGRRWHCSLKGLGSVISGDLVHYRDKA